MIWFDGIENDVDRFLSRMESMHASAINPEKMKSMRDLFAANNIELEPEQSLLDAQGASLGWILKGTKSG